MDAAYWHARWHESRIGFHQERPTPLMLKHWPSLAVERGQRVFVPLCGKSLDMAWLASQGLQVLGVELSPLAIRQFFDELGLEPVVDVSAYGRHYRAGAVEIICGDAFALDEAALAGCVAVLDRAALIALPPKLRSRYATELYPRLPHGCRGLLITLEHPPHEKDGPPFPVPEAEVRDRFAPAWSVQVLERRDILEQQPSFAEEGVTSLQTVVYRLDRR